MNRAPLSVLRRRLPNGLVLLLSRQEKIPLVHVHVVIRCGTADNPADRPGLASLMARMLDEGTGKYTHTELAEIVENLGGSLTTFSDRELSGVSISLLSKDLELGIELAHSVITDPTFPEPRLELERQKVLNQLRSADDNPQIVASNELNRIVYGGHPLGEPILGMEPSIQQATTAELAGLHARTFVPGTALIAVVGDFAVEPCADRLAEMFGDWTPGEAPPTAIPARFPPPSAGFREIAMPKEQVNIYAGHLGIRRADPDYYALQVMDVILGGGPGFTSRIPMKLRDEQGLAYSTYSDISGSAGLYAGRFAAFISTSAENRDRAIGGLRREIESLVRSGITDDELANAQSYLTGSFVFDFQSSGHIARFLLAAEMFDLGFDYMERYPRIIHGVSRSQVEKAARAHLHPESLAVVVAGPTAPAPDASLSAAAGEPLPLCE